MTVNQRKRAIIISVIAVMIILLFIVPFIKKQSTKPISFSSEKWISGNWKERYRMLEDIEQNYELIGMSADEIEEFLGIYSIRCEPYIGEEGIVDYHLGFEVREDYWEGIEVLLISFKNDIVVNYNYAYLSEL